jgi:hypothetical protein
MCFESLLMIHCPDLLEALRNVTRTVRLLVNTCMTLTTKPSLHDQAQDIDACCGQNLFAFDADRYIRGLTAVPCEVDEGSLVPLERGTAPALPHGRSLRDSIESIHILCGGCAHNPRRVIINKIDCTAVLVDTLLNEIRIEENKQDGRQGRALCQPSLSEFSHVGRLPIHDNRSRVPGAEGANPVHQI